MAKAGSLYTSLTLESSQFVVGLKKSVDQAAKSGTAIEQHLNRARTAATAFVGVVAGSQLVAAGKRALDYASSLGEVAQQLGVTTKDLQEYRYAATQAGVSQEQMDAGLAKLTRTIGEAKAGSKAQVATFRELGVAIEDANGRVYTAGEVIPKIADALAKIKDPATRARIEIDLFGKAGQKLDTLLSGGSEAINNLRNAAQKLGIVLSDEQIQNADDTADKLSAVKQVLEANVAGVVTNNAQAILTLANALGQAAAQAVNFAANYPKISAALAGAAIGGRFGGLPGAAIGGIAGYAVGDIAGAGSDDNNMDIAYRRKKLGEARQRYLSLKGQTQAGADYAAERGGGPSGSVAAEEAAAERELRRQSALAMQAARAKAQGGKDNSGYASIIADGALPTAAATPGSKSSGPSGPTAAETEEHYRSQLRSIVSQTLSANASMATSAQERAEISSRQLNDDLREQREEIDNNKHYTKAQRERLKDELKFLEQDERRRIAAELNDQLVDEEVDAKRQALQFEIQSLSLREAIAKTETDRRTLQLQILDKETEMDRLAADGVLRKTLTNDAEKALAQAKLSNLASEKAGATSAIIDRTMGPMERYLSEVPRTADQINEKFEQIAVNGLQNMNDQLANAATNTLKLKGLAGQLFNQLISDVIRLNLQQATGGGGSMLAGLVKVGTSIFGGGGLGGVSASSLSALDAQASAISSRNLTGFATGGSFRIKGAPGIDRNVMSINGNQVARVGDGEIVDIQRAGNDNVGGGDTFMFQGNLMTPEFWAQINAGDSMASTRAVGLTERRANRRRKRRMGR